MVFPALPKAVEYAIKVLVCLALSAARPMPSSQVARVVGIPSAQAAKILNYLSWRGLTRSRRGPNGGYVLSERPEKIHVRQVTELFHPVTQGDSESSSDPILQIWSKKLVRHLRDWEELTIAELSRRAARQWKFPTNTNNKIRRA